MLNGRLETLSITLTAAHAESDVEALLSLGECIDAVEKAFRQQGKRPASRILGMKTANGGLHVKTAFFGGERKLQTIPAAGGVPQTLCDNITALVIRYDA